MRRPEPFEILLPAEPLAQWLDTALALLLASSLTVWALDWAAHAQWPLALQCALAVALMMILLGAQLVWRRRDAPGAEWALHFDGQQWAWACWKDGIGRNAKAERTSESPLRQGRGALSMALSVGPWCLLRASAQPGGQGAWIWVRPGRLQGSGRRLRALLDWT